MVDIVVLQPMAGGVASGIAEAAIAGLDVMPAERGQLSYQPILAGFNSLPQALVAISSPRRVTPIRTLSSTTPVAGATYFYMRGWDANGDQFVYWKTATPEIPPVITVPVAIGVITNSIIVGEK